MIKTLWLGNFIINLVLILQIITLICVFLNLFTEQTQWSQIFCRTSMLEEVYLVTLLTTSLNQNRPIKRSSLLTKMMMICSTQATTILMLIGLLWQRQTTGGRPIRRDLKSRKSWLKRRLSSIGCKLSKRGRLLILRRKIRKCGSLCMGREKVINRRMAQRMMEIPN